MVLIGANEAQAAPTFQAFSGIAAAANGNADPTVTLPAHAENDILLLATIVRSGTATVATPAGWTQIGSPTVRAGTATYQFFWIRAGPTAVPNPLIDRTGTTGDVYAAAVVYRNATSIGDPWEVKGTVTTGTTDPSVIAGITTLTNDSLVVAAVAGEDNNNGSIITTGTNPAAYTEHYVESAVGADGVITFSEAARTTAGATGNVSVNWNIAVPVGFGGIVLALKPQGTVLGNGTDPANTTIGPGGAATMADAFTFQTGTGTDTITDVTVGLGTGAAAGLGLVEITNDAGTTVYGSVTNPATDTPTITLSTNTLTATTTQTQYKIRVTPKSHAAMPAPPGATYTVTAKINSWTGSGTQEGSDTAGTTVTIDNESSGDVTGASGTSGDAQVVFNWTNPTSPPETVAYSIVVLRSTAAVADTPVEGATYAVGNTIGASTVRCVVTGLPPATTCTDSGVGGPVNGTTYYYKIFARDSNGNFSAPGVALGPFTPAATRYAVATGNWDATTTWSAGGCAGAAGASVPTSLNPVVICATRTVTLNVNGACASLTFDTPGAGSTLQHNAGTALDVGGSVTINGSTSADGTRAWSINAGSATVGGNVTLNGGSSNARIARINIATGGTLTISGGLTYNAANAVRAVIAMNTGTGVLNLAGALTINTTGTLTAGTLGSTFNFNGAVAQTIPIGVSSVIYNNLHVNNTSAGGATLSAAISATNVTGNVRVQGAGILNNGGFAIVGGAGDTFEVENGATFNLSGSVMATGFSTKTFGPTSTVRYARVDGNQNVSVETYGHLVLTGGASGGFNKRLLAGTTTIAGNFTLEVDTIYDGPQNNPTVNLAGNFTNNGTFNAGTGVFTFDGNVSKTITGATTFGNLTIAKTGGATVTANSNLTVNGNFTNTAGFNAGSTTTTFSGGSAQTITGVTAFYKLTMNKSANGITLNNDVTVNDTLTFTLGSISTGTANTLIIGNTAGCGVTGASDVTGYVIGNLRKNFSASQLSCPFEIGDSALYTPVSNLTFASITTPDTVTASTTSGAHPFLVDSGISTSNFVNRFWTLTAGSSLVFSTATATFDYIDPDDLIGAVVPDDFIIRRYVSPNWFAVPVHPTIAPTTTTTVTDTAITAFGDFAIGNPGFIYTRESEFIYTRELYY